MQYVFQLTGDVDELGNIVMIKFKLRQGKKMLEILHVTGNEVVHCYDMIIFPDKPITQMRT